MFYQRHVSVLVMSHLQVDYFSFFEFMDAASTGVCTFQVRYPRCVVEKQNMNPPNKR